MTEVITMLVVGLVLIVMGISNMKGNISTLHSYHRKRVKEEDIPAFGKLIGLGTILLGLVFIIYGMLTLLVSSKICTIILIVGPVPGIIIIFYALFKYNKGVF